jgi:hypothetical protein
VYVYYEHLNPNSPLEMLDLALSSDGKTTKLDWKNPKELAQSEIIRSLLKAVPPDERDYDAKTYIWSYVGPAGPRVISVLNQAIQGGLLSGTTLKAVVNLRGLQARGDFKWKPYVPPPASRYGGAWGYNGGTPAPVYNEKDFFYAPPTSKGTGIPSGEALFVALAGLMNITGEQLKAASPQELKKFYRHACIRLHPDKGGDPKKMSELTMLWSAYNAS